MLAGCLALGLRGFSSYEAWNTDMGRRGWVCAPFSGFMIRAHGVQGWRLLQGCGLGLRLRIAMEREAAWHPLRSVAQEI